MIAGSKISSTKLLGHETASVQEMVTSAGRGDNAEMDWAFQTNFFFFIVTYNSFSFLGMEM